MLPFCLWRNRIVVNAVLTEAGIDSPIAEPVAIFSILSSEEWAPLRDSSAYAMQLRASAHGRSGSDYTKVTHQACDTPDRQTL